MKKIIALLLVLGMMFALCGCGKKVPEHLSAETYKLGNEALKYMDDYLNGKLDFDKAKEKLSEIEDSLLNIVIVPDPNSENFANENIQSSNNSIVWLWVSHFGLGMYEVDERFDCQEARDKLYEMLNK